ncbi:MAG: hypothetical protein U0X75_20340 [Acidobacteriota bacterium]
MKSALPNIDLTRSRRLKSMNLPKKYSIFQTSQSFTKETHMRNSHKLTQTLMALFALALMATFSFAADPGLIYPPTSEASDQKAGSLLVYNFYSSGATSGNSENTRINIAACTSTRLWCLVLRGE